jgi:hypothetical protein
MYLKYLIGALFSLSLVFGMLSANQSDFLSLLLWLVPVNIVYFLLLYLSKKDRSISFYLFIAVVIRVSLVFTTPNLSDDYFRFFWDGNVSIQDKNPYDKRPSELIISSAIERDQYLFRHLNSPEYHSVYPPFLQYLFKYSVKLGDNKLDREIFILKVFYAVFSIATVFLLPYLLKLYGVNTLHAVIYVLNPLVILEEMGNLHAEGIMVFFLALFLVALKKQPKFAFLPFSTAIAVKLTPLLLIPAILWRLRLKKGVFFSLGVFLTLVLFFLPYAGGIIKGGFFESLFLYFNKLEFNAFGYNMFKAFGYLTHGYNKIKTLGPLTAILSTVLILYFSFQKRKEAWHTFPLQCLILYFIYLFFSPIIHPWYIIPLIFFSVFQKVQFVFIWSALSLLSYSHYHEGINKEKYYLVFFEYFVVLLFLGMDIYKFYKDKNKMTS